MITVTTWVVVHNYGFASQLVVHCFADTQILGMKYLPPAIQFATLTLNTFILCICHYQYYLTSASIQIKILLFIHPEIFCIHCNHDLTTSTISQQHEVYMYWKSSLCTAQDTDSLKLKNPQMISTYPITPVSTVELVCMELDFVDITWCFGAQPAKHS